jgi:hypothetical protein
VCGVAMRKGRVSLNGYQVSEARFNGTWGSTCVDLSPAQTCHYTTKSQ